MDEDIFSRLRFVNWEKVISLYDGVELIHENEYAILHESAPLYKIIKERVRERLSEDVEKRIEEIISSDKYKEQVETLANDFIDTIQKEWIEQCKKNIIERFCSFQSIEPNYGGNSLREIINEELNKRFQN